MKIQNIKILNASLRKIQKISRAPLSNSKSFEHTTPEKNFVIPQKPTRGLERQVAQGSTTNPNWSQPISEENTHLKSFLPENLPHDVHQDPEMTDRSFLYSDDELTPIQSLRTLKSTNVHTKNIPEDTSDDHSSGLLGTRYLRKRSMSDGDIEPQDTNTDTRDMVSKVKYGKHRTAKSLDELTLNCIFPTYEYAYVTAVRAETETDDLNKHLSVVLTYDSVDCNVTKNLDSPKN